MKFLLELLGMTNQCNLKCSYCDWQKERYFDLTEEHIKTAKNNLHRIKELIDNDYKDIGLIQYSGGEPLLYPEILDDVLDIFSDKWLRINTNGVMLSDYILDKAKKHGKVYFAVSLDGSTMRANHPRVNGNETILNTILNNINRIVEKKVPLMILCTLNKENIEEFPGFIEYLEENYYSAIEEGMLVMPTHCVTSYGKDNGAPTEFQIGDFRQYLSENRNKSKLISNILLHYENLECYLVNKQRSYNCNIYDWTISMHFRRNDIIDSGKFLGFGCGMRGVHELGYFDVNSDKDMGEFKLKVDHYDKCRKLDYYNSEEQVSEHNDLNENCEEKCFPDWVYFDLLLLGKVSIEEAANWFVVFKDPNIQSLVKKYQEEKDILKWGLGDQELPI